MVQHRRGRGLMLLGAGLTCTSGLGLAVLGVWEASQNAMWHQAHLQSWVLGCYVIIACGAALSLLGGMLTPRRDLRWSSIGLSGGVLLATGLLAVSSFAGGWLKGVLVLGAGGSMLFGAAASWRQWRGSRA